MSQNKTKFLKDLNLLNQYDLTNNPLKEISYSKSQTSFIIIGAKSTDLTINVQPNTELELIMLNYCEDVMKKGIDLKVTFNLSENSSLNIKLANLSNQSINEEIIINLKEPGAKADYYSATMAFENLEKRSFINPIHLARNTASEICSYTVIKDSALGFVKCASDIRNGSTSSEAHQELRLLILDTTARAHSDPILLIDENDIVASHANAIGMLDQEQIFYLNSRGLNNSQAQEVLILGYFKPVLETIAQHNEPLMEYLIELLKEKIK
ncbi:SufB/SufD family protein [Spiroplasma alleghenense]|uniref:FeS assembly protein SufD n=1 Tax=Spiroplasma alleghenense TaxID=216931 RepID=A0A345Z3Z2_9MOLU|nr:SufD family Fe-S cluster assembly protein [Spiroplasma alleghenense]AXK51321.1 FeS assembly protein SufD [Spiroplasma alleghenense]